MSVCFRVFEREPRYDSPSLPSGVSAGSSMNELHMPCSLKQQSGQYICAPHLQVAETQRWAHTQVLRLWDLRRKFLKSTVVLPTRLEVATFAAPRQLLTQGQGHLVLWRNGRAAHRFPVLAGTLGSPMQILPSVAGAPCCTFVQIRHGRQEYRRLDLCAFM